MFFALAHFWQPYNYLSIFVYVLPLTLFTFWRKNYYAQAFVHCFANSFGATLALAALILYLVLRVVLHGDAIAALESRTYRGELAHKVAAFAESNSPFRWHGIVETERALHDVEVPVGPGADFDPGSAVTTYKPEPTPALDAARNSSVASRFLQLARFPKATVEQTSTGFHVILRAFPYSRDSGLRVQALIDTDPSGKILSGELAWISSSHDFP